MKGFRKLFKESSFQVFPPRYAGQEKGYLHWEIKELASQEDSVHKIILKAFDEWSTDVNPEDKRIRIFQHIRDIPFLMTGIADPENGPVGIEEPAPYDKGIQNNPVGELFGQQCQPGEEPYIALVNVREFVRNDHLLLFSGQN